MAVAAGTHFGIGPYAETEETTGSNGNTCSQHNINDALVLTLITWIMKILDHLKNMHSDFNFRDYQKSNCIIIIVMDKGKHWMFFLLVFTWFVFIISAFGKYSVLSNARLLKFTTQGVHLCIFNLQVN